MLFIYNCASASEKEFLPGKDSIYLKVAVEDKDKESIDQIKVKLISALGQDKEEVILTETTKNSGLFRTEKGIKLLAQKKVLQDGILQVSTSLDIIYVLYPEGPHKERVVATLISLPAIDKFSVLVDNTIQTAGKSFPVEIIARDRQNNVLGDYAGIVTVEAEGKQLLTTSSFSGGRAKIFLSYPEAGRVKIRVKDLNQKTGQSQPIVFLPAKFKVEALAPQPYIVGKEFALKITALNYRDEVAQGYHGPAVVKPFNTRVSSWGNILFNKGVAETKVTYNQWGERRFIVCDKKYPDICGISGNLFFAPYNLKVEIDSAPRDRKKFYFEELFKGKVRVFDYQGKLIPKYGGVAILEPVKDVDLPQKLYFGWHTLGEDRFYVSGVTEKPFKVKVYDALFPEAKGESNFVNLMSAQIKVEPVEVKEGKAKLKIKIEDKQGNITKEDNSTIFTIHLVESNLDESAYLVGAKKIKARNGQALITIANKQKETVTVVPESEPYLEAEPLEINF